MKKDNEYVSKNDPKTKACTYFIICACAMICVNSLTVYLHTGCGAKGLLVLSFVFLLLIPLTLMDDRRENRGSAAAIAYTIAAVGLTGFCGVHYRYTAIYIVFLSEILVCAIVGRIVLRSK